MLTQDDNPLIPVHEKLPEPGKRVIVITARFRCLGYLDEKNVWRHHSNNSEIKSVTAWTEQA